jgi:NADPH:quinone reductase-like Zn-dependent oxidoreductase
MKALVLKRYGGSDPLAFADLPRPTIKPDEVLVQVHAAGLNAIDCMIPKGAFKPILRFQLPATMGSDLAGVVVEAGSRVTRFKPGDAVFASIFDLGTGALAEYAVVPESAAAIKPAGLDFVQAASIPMVGLTSWQALKGRAGLKQGQKVFVPALCSMQFGIWLVLGVKFAPFLLIVAFWIPWDSWLDFVRRTLARKAA